jgi:hypothetical protein
MANAPELGLWMFIGILVIVLGVALAYGLSRWSQREGDVKARQATDRSTERVYDEAERQDRKELRS